jgi:hypothetical protein
MLSALQSSVVYPVTQDVVETDLDTDVEEYNYDGRLVYRGNIDPSFSTKKVQVYWLYNENSQRVGLVEHSDKFHKCLWYRDNVFSTLLQEDWEPQNRTIWSLLTQEAYEDCMKHGWTTVEKIAQRTHLRIISPNDLIADLPDVTRCVQCMGERQEKCVLHTQKTKIDPYSTLFVDEDGVLYTPPSDSVLFSIVETHEPKQRVMGSGK